MPVLRVLFSDGVGFYSVCVRVLSGIFWGWELLRKTICKWQQITILNYFCFKTLHSLLGLTWLKLAEAGVQPALLSSLYTQCVQKAKAEVMNVAQHWYYFCEFTETKRFYDWKNMLKKNWKMYVNISSGQSTKKNLQRMTTFVYYNSNMEASDWNLQK